MGELKTIVPTLQASSGHCPIHGSAELKGADLTTEKRLLIHIWRREKRGVELLQPTIVL